MALAPPPLKDPIDSRRWLDWYFKVTQEIDTAGTTGNWVDLVFTSSNITDIVTRNHHDLQSLDGGSGSDHFHLTSAQHTNLTAGNVVVMNTGTYTGDGTTSQAITGVGFQPKYVKIWERTTTGTTIFVGETTDTIVDDHASGMFIEQLTGTAGSIGTGGTSKVNALISLDSDGFTVDDGLIDRHPNTDTVVYNYLALGVI